MLFFNDATMSNLETLSKEYPDVFLDVVDILNANKGPYTVAVNKKLGLLKAQLGIEVDDALEMAEQTEI
mgnify:CR=1 FL=1